MPSSQTPCPPSPSFPWRRASQSLAAAALAAAALAGCGDRTQGGASGRAPQYSRPPIVVVNIDTLRADHLGSYGYRRDTSPNLDALAAESVRFEWAFAQAPSTAPSQASILTGRYPRSHGRQLGTERVDPQVETLAEALSEAGYRTAAFVDGGLMSTGAGLEQGFEVYNDDAGR
ncbi:MAG: sulfatase-like hydrolase/transferase, partial [Acidobacteriota bacterium]